MNILKKWWNQLSYKRKMQARESGYNWAIDGLRREKLTLEEIEGCVGVSKTFGDYDEFDKGVEQACNEWRSRDELSTKTK